MAFTFPAMVAWDPNGKQNVKNVSFQVYAVTDTTFSTPLALTDTFNNPLPGNILNSGTAGVFPQFMQATNSTVVITDATHVYAWTVNCVQQDTATASFINTVGTATQAALSATYASKANNLSDLASASTARTNLGLGDSATHPATDFLAASQKGATSGVAPLDAGAKVPVTNIPDQSSTYVTKAPGSNDQTIGGMPVQKVTGNKWFQGMTVFGNNTGLAADPRQPFQINNVIDGSLLTNATYGGDKGGLVLDVTWKGGFSREAGWGMADPGFLFGADFYIVTGTSTGDLAGITDMFAFIGEQHLNTPGASITHMTGVQGQADVNAAATVTGGAYAIKGVATANTAGAVVNDLFSVYAVNPVIANSPTVTRARAFFTDGMAQFAGSVSNGSGSASPSKGAYLGIAASGAVGLELSNGTGADNFSISNDQAGHISFAVAGTAVLATIDKNGGLAATGATSVGTGSTGTTTPGSQAAAKGAYLGRNSGGTIGLELGDGTNNFRVSNDSAGHLNFEKSGVAVLGQFDGSGNLSVTGGLKTALKTVNSNYSVAAADSVILASGAGVTITLPSPVTMGAGRRFVVKNKDATNTVTVATAAGSIDGSATQTLAVNQGHYYVSDGTNWIGMV